MSDQNEQHEDDEFTTRIGPLEIDWPRSLGYFGGIGLAVALDLIAPPLALFVAAVPFLKLMKRRRAGLVERAVAATLEGVAKPVGGDSESTVRLAEDEEEDGKHEAKAQRSPEEPRADAPRAEQASVN